MADIISYCAYKTPKDILSNMLYYMALYLTRMVYNYNKTMEAKATYNSILKSYIENKNSRNQNKLNYKKLIYKEDENLVLDDNELSYLKYLISIIKLANNIANKYIQNVFSTYNLIINLIERTNYKDKEILNELKLAYNNLIIACDNSDRQNKKQDYINKLEKIKG